MNVPYFLLKSLHLMAHLVQGARQVLAIITHHGLVWLLIMNAIGQILIPWEVFQDFMEE